MSLSRFDFNSPLLLGLKQIENKKSRNYMNLQQKHILVRPRLVSSCPIVNSEFIIYKEMMLGKGFSETKDKKG